MKKAVKISSSFLILVLVVVMSFGLFSCAKQPVVDKTLDINVTVLSGTTGFGMAPLMQNSADGTAVLNYRFTVESDASNVSAGLIQGTIDIAALPTNAASVLYNKTKGEILLLALNTRGVLYLLDGADQGITSFSDLRGKTVAVPAQNPTFIFSYLCEKNGLAVGKDIFIDSSYTSPAELQANVAAGKVTLAVLPEPMVTITKSSNQEIKVVLNLTEEWDKVSPAGSLVQGCVVVRREFAENHPAEVKKFLEEYEASVNEVISFPKTAAEKIAAQGIFAKAAVAQKAIPNCNLCFVTGNDMKTAMQEFLNIMYQVQPASVGGAIPGDDFYYTAK